MTLVNQTRLLQVGYDPTAEQERIQITTGSGVEFVPQITLSRFAALGQERTDFSVISHNLPSSANVDGLLGLDFFHELEVTIDFRTGILSLV